MDGIMSLLRRTSSYLSPALMNRFSFVAPAALSVWAAAKHRGQHSRVTAGVAEQAAAGGPPGA